MHINFTKFKTLMGGNLIIIIIIIIIMTMFDKMYTRLSLYRYLHTTESSPNSPEQGVALNMLRATPCSSELGDIVQQLV